MFPIAHNSERLRISVAVLALTVVTSALTFRNCLAIKMGRPTGLEPATPRSTILCSNQLSYDRRKVKNAEFREPVRHCQSLCRSPRHCGQASTGAAG